jgi:hypothetical protein
MFCYIQAQDPIQSTLVYHYVISVSMPVLDVGENKVISYIKWFVSLCNVKYKYELQ